MQLAILGGDGFCGWPTVLHLSKLGHDITIIDNLSRRKIDKDLKVQSLTPITSIYERLKVWKEITGKEIKFENIDLAKEYNLFLKFLIEKKVDTVIHFAEQRSAPYSMKNSNSKCYTVDNNINATNNILSAIVESGLEIHLVHLGSMGVYGYGNINMKIPEGYLKVNINNEIGEKFEQEILYPANPGSIYHMTKNMDALMFQFYKKNDNLLITDLHQGIVWGTDTSETLIDERLINRFDYDGEYGTVLNRFIMQAAVNHPLTVHGTGRQTRAFIHIKDTAKCIELAIKYRPKKNDRVKILNQMTETHNIKDLAKTVSSLTGAKIEYLINPRNEDSENDLFVENDCFLQLGLKPTTLKEGLIIEIKDIAKKYSNRYDKTKIVSKSFWNKKIAKKYKY